MVSAGRRNDLSLCGEYLSAHRGTVGYNVLKNGNIINGGFNGIKLYNCGAKIVITSNTNKRNGMINIYLTYF